MASIKPGEVREAILKIEKRGAADQAGRVLQRVKAVYRWAVIHERIASNPMLDLVLSEILKPREVQHRAAMADKELPEFLRKHLSRLWRRYVYNYLVRDFNVGSLYSLSGALLILAGGGFGAWQWLLSTSSHLPATSGTVMLAALPVFIGIQCLIAFLHHDVSNVPTEPLSLSLQDADDPSDRTARANTATRP